MQQQRGKNPSTTTLLQAQREQGITPPLLHLKWAHIESHTSRLHSLTQASHVSKRAFKTPTPDQPSSHHWFIPNVHGAPGTELIRNYFYDIVFCVPVYLLFFVVVVPVVVVFCLCAKCVVY